MATTSSVRITQPREVLALVPHQVGFTPEESVVALSLRGPRGRVGLMARVDIAALADPADGTRLALSLVGQLERDGAWSVVLVVYTATDPRARPGHPAVRAVRRLRRAGEAFGEMSAWVVTATGYLDLDCVDGCCPPGGRPLVELESTQIIARLSDRRVVVARREDVAAIRGASAEARRGVARVCARWAVRGAQAAEVGVDALERWRLDSVRVWRGEVARALAGSAPPRAPGLGKIEAGLRDLRVRDAVLATLVSGTDGLPEDLVRGEKIAPEADTGLARALDAIYRPERGVEPPPETVVHVRLLESVVAHGRTHQQAPACTLLALLAWWSGEGARANLLLERALRCDAGYRLARMLAQAVSDGVVPGWLQVRRGRPESG
ncbi:MAG: DUF4192 domain-containing protein [Micrococcales bacterium]|nr:DUF4192 domain-containing protein [Micrococcales bacterium]